MKAVSIREPSRLGRTASFRPLLTSALLAGALACNQTAPPQDGETRSTTSTGEGRRTAALTGGIQFIQLSYATPQSSVSTLSVKYVAAQTVGNLNVVVVGWNDTSATVSSVTDTSGNVYSLAVGPTAWPGALTQSIYYSASIKAAAAGANSVKVVFSRAADFVDVRILEYSGIAASSPVDAVAAATGTAATSDSGPATTTNANDLLIGANMTTGTTSAAGSGWTNRIITQPDTDIAEERIVSTTGTYRATAAVSSGSPWVMQMVAFKGAPTDSQPPSAPGALSATGATSSRIDLSWGAATDNLGVTGYLVERCAGTSCSNFAQIASVSGSTLTYSDAGLTPSSGYSYRVRASDGAGNLGPYTNVSIATTLPDSAPPSPPASLTASAISSTRVDLSWSAASDDVAVTGYLIERCQGAGCSSFAQIAAPTGTGVAYSDTGLTAGTTYSYRVRATDGAGNLGGYSPVSTATTPTPDVTPPSAPATLSATAVSNTQVNLSWAAANDNVAVTGYLIERCQGSGCSTFAQIAAPAGTGTTYGDAGLTASTSYSYRVRATDGAGNLGPYSPVGSATTLSTPPAPVIPKFVQGNYATPQSNKSSVPIAFTAAQRAGNFNVVIVGWNDTSASVTGVTDTKGNVYTRAIGPTQNPGVALPVHLLLGEHHRGDRRWKHRHRHLLALGRLRRHPRPRIQRGGPHRRARRHRGGDREQRHQQQREPHHHRSGRPPGLREHGLHPHPRAGQRLDAPLRHLSRRRHGRGPHRHHRRRLHRQRSARRRRELGAPDRRLQGRAARRHPTQRGGHLTRRRRRAQRHGERHGHRRRPGLRPPGHPAPGGWRRRRAARRAPARPPSR